MQLNKAYNKEGFNEFLTAFLPDDLSLSEKELVIGDNYKNIKSGLILGESKSLGVKVFYLEHEKEKDPRVALTTEAFKILSENWAKKALVVFNSKNSENWRLSLMTISFDINEKNKIVSNLSNPKRKSFFLGPNAKIATAKQFLFSKGGVKDFEDLESRFDVEIVTKEFFNNYKKLYTKLLDYLKNDKAFDVFSARHGLELEIFGKKLLGQIVFIYFLQKKGWLGAKKGDNISNGDKIFLRNIFEKCKKEKKNFFNNYLEQLFYDCLNKVPERAGSFYREKFDCQIPFLNGGLFEPINDYKWQNEFINIPNEIFSNDENSGILDVFDLYNFTIDENTPDDQEISVDPEMLGKVFENLLESNTRKGQGAFYTPREIVHYMCRESLVNYLATNHSNLSEDGIRNYVFYGDVLSKDISQLNKAWKGESFTPGQFKELDELLKNIKVVDPACGSGAFLVGMLQEIVKLRTFLQLTPDSELFSKSSNYIKELTVYDLKKETIQNCLYGVDIDPGAIDIAKLRFWLSIVVEENIEDIEPLPNLDYKIMQGNSLLEDLVIGDSVIPLKFEEKKKIDGRTKEKKDLFNESYQAKLFIDESEALVEKLEKYHTEYFNITDPEKKKILKKKIDGVEDELIQSKCNEEIERADSFIKNNPNDSNKILKYTEKILAIKEVLRKWKIDHLRPFFPWKLHFGEVFNRDNGGFDVVIANPPYVDSETMTKNNNGDRDVYKKFFKSAKGNWDLFVIFIEKGFLLLRLKGTISYIVPNKLISAGYTSELRNYLLSKNIKELRSYSRVDVFREVSVYPVVFVATNDDPWKDVLFTTMKSETDITSQYFIKPALFYQDIFWDKYFLPKAELEIILKLSPISKLSSLIHSINDAATVSEAYEIKKYIVEKSDGVNECKKLINTGTIDPYISLWGRGRTQYIKNSYIRPIIKDADIKLVNSNRLKQAVSNKIIIAGMSKRIECFYDEGEYLAGKSTTIILESASNSVSLKYLLALMNSKLISFWYSNFFNSLKMAGGYLNVSSKEIGLLPIKKIDTDKQDFYAEIVDEIMVITKDERYLEDEKMQEKVLEYEKKIDKMVYELYRLTDEEIKIIENRA